MTTDDFIARLPALRIAVIGGVIVFAVQAGGVRFPLWQEPDADPPLGRARSSPSADEAKRRVCHTPVRTQKSRVLADAGAWS